MTHFVVLCITESDPRDTDLIDKLLAPYDENLDIEAITDDDGEEYMTNPQGYWDWWEIGGRWSDHLRLRDGSHADQARVGDIDWDGWFADNLVEFGKRWDDDAKLLAQYPQTRSWDQILAEYDVDGSVDQKVRQENLEVARNVFRNQPIAQALVGRFGVSEMIDEHLTKDRDQMIEVKALGAILGYAVLASDIGWRAPGRMGWFATSTETDAERIDFRREAFNYVKGLHPDKWVTVVDCHV